MADTMNRTDAATTLLRTLLSAAGRIGRGIRWYMTTLMGDTAYATYVAHQRRVHPHEEPMSERQFWRQRMDDQDRNPGARCC
ncbi:MULTISPECIES: YbdD/YjiX family protein [unclassified Microbacterium]|uniref:YbdD/YjiX family protein n=1 Tax=unclassified Microbacterium TaxID=2609290 RepID=UPI00160501AB|nr:MULTISPECIES: YbdD/YjiX family protein [unclassified Microbacterium]QYM64853.1 YbdD/YjiX family protein [Microbacterium sp. Se5.02b]